MSSQLPHPIARWSVPAATLAAAALGWWAGGASVAPSAREASSSKAPPPLASAAVTREIDSLLGKVASEKLSSHQFALLASAPPPRTPGALRAWLDRLEQLPNSEARELAERLLFREDAEVPYEAMASVLTNKDYRATASLAELWAKREGLAGLTRALHQPSARGSYYFISTMAAVCARTDPQGTLALLQQDAAGPNTANAIGSALAEWVKLSPADAVAALDHLPAEQRASVSYRLASSWAALDPAKAMEWAKSQDSSSRADLCGQVAEAWANTAPELAADALLAADPNGFSTMSSTWASKDPGGMLAWLERQPDVPSNVREQLLVNAASQLAETDPERAWAAVRDASPSQRSNVLVAISQAMFASDPAAAMAWAGRLENTSDRASFVRSLSGMAAGLSDEQRASVLAALPDDAPGAPSAKLNLLAVGDAAAARKYWEGLPPESRNSILAIDFDSLSRRAPELAAMVMRDALMTADREKADPPRSGRAQDFQASIVAVALAARDPRAAKDWIDSLPPGTAAADAAANFAANQGRFDRAGLEAWLAEQPAESPVRGGLLRGLARLDVTLGDPAAAFQRVSQLSPTEPGRMTALLEVFQAWNEIDPGKAAQAAGTLSLTPEERLRCGLPPAP